MTTIFVHAYASPLGTLRLESDGRALTRIRLPQEPWPRIAARDDPRPFADVVAQLDAYFAGSRAAFDLPLASCGTPFPQDVWRLLREIPYGTTVTYGELARRLGRPAASRAVGAANGRNPWPIVVPCHRVIGANGALTGYAGGLDAKRFLLAREGAAV